MSLEHYTLECVSLPKCIWITGIFQRRHEYINLFYKSYVSIWLLDSDYPMQYYRGQPTIVLKLGGYDSFTDMEAYKIKQVMEDGPYKTVVVSCASTIGNSFKIPMSKYMQRKFRQVHV